MALKLRGQHFNTIEETQTLSQKIFDMTGKTFMEYLRHSGSGGITVSIQEEAISKGTERPDLILHNVNNYSCLAKKQRW